MTRISARGIQIERLSLPRLAWLLVALVTFWHLVYVTSSEKNRDKVIGSDGVGYYAYLPAVFIYHDYGYKFCIPGEPTKLNYFSADHAMFLNKTKDGKWINKYFIGTAIAQLPFFLVAYGTASWFGYSPDGYSFPFQLSIAIATIFFTLLGLEQIRRLLNKKGIGEAVQAVVILLLFFGTNLFHYALDEPSMSHAYSFGIIAVFLNQAYNIFHGRNRFAIMWAMLALTLIVFLRPVNGIIIFALPFIAGSWKNFIEGVRFALLRFPMILIGISGFALALFLQLLTYKLGVGTWIADSYTGEYFDLTNAHVYKVLFSWRKGWFVYTPLMIFAVAGFFFFKNHFERFAFLFFLLLNIWIVSSWQKWEYGGSLGMRPMIDTYSVMAIPLAFFLQTAVKKWRLLIAIPVLGFFVLLNLVQHYQFKNGILPYDEMTGPRYRKIFFRTSEMYCCIYDPGSRRMHMLPANASRISNWIRTFEEDSAFGTSFSAITGEKFFEGKHAIKLDTGRTTSGICISLQNAVPDSLLAKTWVVVKANVFLTEGKMTPKYAVSFRSGGQEYYIDAHPLFFEVDETGSWQDFQYALKLPIPPGPGGEVCCFLIHDDQSVAYADNMQVEFWIEQ